MWSDEVERIGKQRCTPVGYNLQAIGDLIGFSGLLLLIGVVSYLVYMGIAGTFRWMLLWWLAVPFVIGIAGSIIVSYSWSLAYRKQFRYHYEHRVSTWIVDGQEQSYSYADWESEMTKRKQSD